jgi:hypothetical protein
VEADFSGGNITSNGGIPRLSRQIDRQMGLPRRCNAIADSRRQASCDPY